ncbi:magnesium chelatase ATPase subunit D [Limihaloglobus sulfuriphilus]|uniref:Magnesium chelatase ATPase subunit D n=1 Tax=Limihaloglobus sulfuriphilus TaxID=1851148 RepID=A0A1Q2MFL1_9BACT|nr:MoxR family ATPase [Limihaloglobus sulfuriphilus]AQQ71077.1 magnesium chelatase ATPase subunit D [Limihaloglobus sulfuriphilus]
MNNDEFSKELSEGKELAGEFLTLFNAVKDEVHKVFVGHDDLVNNVLSALFAGGHVLLEGVPGLGKTLLARTLSTTLNLDYSRIQFTPDLMPADIVGSMVLVEKPGGGHEITFQNGPVITNFILADEINRATPKTQSAMLEAMQEAQVSVGTRTIDLPQPNIVIATQNPIEQDGTYPLPEAQLDRFLVKLIVGYPKRNEYEKILNLTTGSQMPELKQIAGGEDILRLRKIVRSVEVSHQVQDYAVKIVMATQPGTEFVTNEVRDNVALGSSPRGAQGLMLMGKVRALLDGRFALSCQDIRDVAKPVLRHRIMLNFHGYSNKVSVDSLISGILEKVPEVSEVDVETLSEEEQPEINLSGSDNISDISEALKNLSKPNE